MPLTTGQSKAVAARGNVIVVAGAGTGKTSTLVERCLDVVREGISLDRVLMVTFTNAAAAEMRHRLRVSVRELAGSTTDAFERERFTEQLALVERARICTIHSFCLRLVRSYFHELGVDPGVDVLDERQCQVIAAQTLEQLMKDCCSGSLRGHEAVRALIAAYAPDRDSLVPELVLGLHKYTQSLRDAAGWIRTQETAWTTPPLARWEGWLTAAFVDWRRLWLPVIQGHAGVKNINACLTAMSSESGEITRAKVAVVTRAVAEAGAAAWPEGTAGRVRDPLNKFFGEASFLASVAPDGALEKDWQALSEHMRALLALTTEFSDRFARAKRELAGVDFPDLEQLTLRLLLDAAGQPSPVAHEIQGQTDYVFVDECQDINCAQDAILSAVSRGGAAANRFLVGDVKQSIYQFRLANPHIFRRYETGWSDGNAGQRILLAENFRSRPEILEFVNLLFGGLMRESFGGVSYEPLQAAEGGGPGRLGDKARVELHLIRNATGGNSTPCDNGAADITDLSAAQREARLVAHRLRALQESGFMIWDKEEEREREVEWRDMVVLLRSPRPRIEAYAKEFHRSGIPLAAARAGFLEAIEISDLVSLLKLLDNPLQDIPLLAVLRSPLVGLSLDELATIRASSEEKPFWHVLKHFTAGVPEDAEGDAFHLVLGKGDKNGNALKDLAPDAALRARVSCFLHQIDRWRALVRQVGPSMCLERILTDTSYEALLSANERGAEQVANVRRLLDDARQFDPYQRQGLYRFLRFIQSLEEAGESLEPAPMPVRNAVQLMSIHRSKGLEFPVVVMAGLGSRFNLRNLSSVILLDQKYGLAPKATTSSGFGRYPTLPFWLAERRQRAQQLGEELRLLYVAVTRARDRLILTGTMPGSDRDRWESCPAQRVSDHALLAGGSPMDWLAAWLPTVTKESDWLDDSQGASVAMSWKLWDPQDPRLGLPAGTVAARNTVNRAGTADEKSVDRVVRRISWQYRHEAATTEAAKSSVSALRARALQLTDEEAVSRFPGSRFRTGSVRKQDNMTAAERGTLYHRLLQYIELDETADPAGLTKQVMAMVERGLFTRPEADVLNLERIAAFWSSDVGRAIRMAAVQVRRELPFTVRFDDAEVRSILGQKPEASLAGEFVVVQGVVDLAVVLEDEIWLLDFKTDEVEGDQLKTRTEEYRPQLRLYAVALERIYGRPVRHSWLHFLATGRTVELA